MKSVGLIVLLALIAINGCKTTTFHGHTLGWNNDNVYVLRVTGVWDRNTYYIDGQEKSFDNLGKIPVSAFELKRQSEIFARSRAVFTFQEEMENYFKDYEYVETDFTENNENNLSDELVEEDIEPSSDSSLTTTVEASQVLLTSNQEPRVFYTDPNQNTNTSPETTMTNIKDNEVEPVEVIEPDIPTFANERKTIDFREIYEKVNLEITLLERIYTKENDVDIIYVFYGRNLKQELAKAFNASSGEIELRK